MFLKSHDLDCVISQFGHLRKHVLAKFLECPYLFLFAGHSDMALVNKRMRPLARLAVTPFVRLLRSPYLSAELLGNRVLNGSGSVGRKPLRTSARPLDVELVQRAVIEEHGIQDNFPIAVPDRFEGICL